MKSDNADKIVAVTIGPIYDTMLLAIKPAGLWGASFLFSYIAKRIVECVSIGKVITPYFDFAKNQKAQELQKMGVGFYHDHILIKGGDLDEVEKAIDKVKCEVGSEIFKCLVQEDTKANEKYTKCDVINYISSYLQIHAVEASQKKGENAIQATSKILDACELEKGFVAVETRNYIAHLLENNVIKGSFLVKYPDKWMLSQKDGSIKDLTTIALSDFNENDKGNDFYKRYNYYAMVSSDGDRMGEIIKSLNEDDDIREFSNDCMIYNQKACNAIIGFGGIVIYAGGDDLQFIAPLTRKKGDQQCTIFDLLADITCCFKDVFRKGRYDELEKKPSVSFGIAIAYTKYPLYENLNESYNLLHKAKNRGRDSVVIRLQKHSGQTSEVCISKLQDNYKDFNEKVLEPLLEYQFKTGDEALKSVIFHLSEGRSACEVAIKEDRIESFTNNSFDNPGQEKWTEYLEKIQGLMKKTDIYKTTIEIEENKEFEKTDSVISLLRIIQFFGEKGKEEQNDEDITS